MTHSVVTISHLVLYVPDVVDNAARRARCRIEAWRPPGVDEISEVFHATIVDYGYPAHAHDTWTVLIVDAGAITYDLDKRPCGAVGDTVAILPPGVVHDGKPAAGTEGFVKRVLYLDENAIPLGLIGAAVDRTNIADADMRAALAGLHDELVRGADPLAASCSLALISERITDHLTGRGPTAPVREPSVAFELRALLDGCVAQANALDLAAKLLDRSKPHLIRSFTAQFGVAPHAYVIGRRVEAARKLLLDGEPPAEVAHTVGFYDQSHFTRHFKRHTSMPPAAFASSHAGE